MSERTPGRWVLSGKQTIRTESGAWIGKTNWSNGAANAEFIVRACNAHDDLVAALESVADESAYAQDAGSNERINAIARAALAKAAHETPQDAAGTAGRDAGRRDPALHAILCAACVVYVVWQMGVSLN